MNFEAAKTWEGQVVDGKFLLLQWLGSSGQSAVFLTEIGSTRAAIKLIAADTLDANVQLLRWQQASQLTHPHLLRLFTEGRCEIEGTRLLYVVKEYAEENLSEILGQRALTTKETRDLLHPVLDALAYLHGEDLVHGRIQPSNILAQGNQIKLSVDRILGSGDVGDRTQLRRSYDAPELKTEALSPAADVWSLGVTLVEVLTQRKLASDQSLSKELHVPEAVPEPFRSIARDCLQSDPKQRCTIAEIQARLRAAPPVPPRPMTAPPPAPAENNSSRVRLLIPVAAILLLAAVFVGPKLLSYRAESSPKGTGKTEQPSVAPGPLATSPSASRPSNSTPNRVASRGEVARQVLPTVPQSARSTIQGKVRVGVRVQVDPSGKVTSATLAPAGPSKYFAKLALRAAQQWQFTPPQADGQAAPSAWLLRFQFGRTGTQVFPTQERR
jgi:TonB family protein